MNLLGDYGKMGMTNMNYYQFLILQYLAGHQDDSVTYRELSDNLLVSNAMVMKVIDTFLDRGLVGDNGRITEAGLSALEPYRVQHAVILAAGFGSRMMPATADRPKPMVSVNGKPIVTTLLDALLAAGIQDITIVRGYQKQKFNELLAEYPMLHFIDNDDYTKYNNISSAVLAKNSFVGSDNGAGCYLCEADLLITNPRIITPYQYCSNILGSYSIETDDWNFKMGDDGYISSYQKGNTYCWNYYGISYWTADDCRKLNRDWADLFSTADGKDIFWEQVPLQLRQNQYHVAIRPCQKQDIMEIDNYYELQQLDPNYR